MRVNTAQPAKTVLRHAGATEIGHFDLLGIADHHIFDLTFAVNENTDLPAGFK